MHLYTGKQKSTIRKTSERFFKTICQITLALSSRLASNSFRTSSLVHHLAASSSYPSFSDQTNQPTNQPPAFQILKRRSNHGGTAFQMQRSSGVFGNIEALGGLVVGVLFQAVSFSVEVEGISSSVLREVVGAWWPG